MEGKYDVFLDGRAVGQARVERQGLYYRVFCRCGLAPGEICRVTAVCGGKSHDLGILAPENGAFTRTARVPVRRLGEGTLLFRAERAHPAAPSGRFYPVRPGEPFPALSMLERGRFERREGQAGVFIPEAPAPDPQDSDPTP